MGDVPQPMLRIDHGREGDAHVIRLVGEMDLSNTGEARKALLSAVHNVDVNVIVDMSELEFIDSLGISMLLEVQAVARSDSDRLYFRGTHSEVARILQLTEVDKQLRFID